MKNKLAMNLAFVICTLFSFATLSPTSSQEIVLADFEGEDYGEWEVTGDAFGQHPARGTLPDQMNVSGFLGKGLVNSFVGRDESVGTLTSASFEIKRDYITFLVGGGDLPDQLGMELLIDGKRVRFQTGINDERLRPKYWEVKEFLGKVARLRIFDKATRGWGHINIDQIVMTNEQPFIVMRLSDYRKSKQYYKEKYRPQFHFTPEMNWMNDPNGLVYYEGEYHLFYQHNPHGNEWGHMSWGHAVSTDLVHWKHLPIALHDEHGVMVFSGCCVVDWNNTSGFGKNGKPPLVAVYTGHGFENQTQDLAYSNDNGRTWTKFSGNPVLDLRNPNFRDPKVFWSKQSRQWIMLVSLAEEKKLQFYGSPDLKKWKWLSDFQNAGVKNKPNWECPDLFELPVENEKGKTKWVLEVDMGNGAIAGGSGGEYFVGEFDGTTFTCDDPEKNSQWVDFGRDFYAPVSFSDIPRQDGRRIWIGWMNNWETCLLPTSRWRSAMSVPRELTLRKNDSGYVLVQRPVKEIESLRMHGAKSERPIKVEGHLSNGMFQYFKQTSAYEIVATVNVADCEEFGIWVRGSKEPSSGKPEDRKERTLITYNKKSGKLSLDRRKSGQVDFHPRFPGVHSAPVRLKDGKLNLRILIDTSSIEVFAQDGEVVITDRIFPSAESRTNGVFSKGGKAIIESLEQYQLKSVWHPAK